ncbi:sigma-70 family RNA polymerase sigma factor [Candidatus Uabimicrobium amorphum]|uniref:Uncharacterized protein n=2 Tax=Uabimicrobium amorphum TaxID=2596890 RepID=A0A5S9IQK1_UABAM|nr:hypothetical protein UABAM_04128 [Candidatus Uabimicrobium amorphum]
MNLQRNCSTLTIELIQYIQQNPGTVAHMNKFLLKYQDAIYKFIFMATGDYHDSLDITNKVLLSLAKKVTTMDKKKSFNFLVIKLIKGELSNYWQKQRTNKMQMLKQALHNNQKFSIIENLETCNSKAGEILDFLVINNFVENSNIPYVKNIFLLKYRDGKSLNDIAMELQISKHQVQKSLQELCREVEVILRDE